MKSLERSEQCGDATREDTGNPTQVSTSGTTPEVPFSSSPKTEHAEGNMKKIQVIDDATFDVFFSLVSDMRKAQTLFFKTRNNKVLQESKFLEKQVDHFIKDYYSDQLNLF